jgi:hypothetical protein
VRGQISAIFGGKKVELRGTPKAVTPFGGLAVFVEFLRQIGFAEQVKRRMPFELKSPNAIAPVETPTLSLFLFRNSLRPSTPTPCSALPR